MGREQIAVEDLTFEALQTEADNLRERINRYRTSLGRFFVDKQEIIDLMVVAASPRNRCFWSARLAPPNPTSC